MQIIPNSPDKVVAFFVDVYESDSSAPLGGSDDRLGGLLHVLNMANGWGMLENQGIYESGPISKVNNISWSVQPDVNIATLSETEKFWGVENRSTPRISHNQYAAAFRDVDSDPEFWDVTDWLEAAFYELVVKGLAHTGNCFGMSLEAIYARKSMSQFSLPINRFASWDTVVSEFNIKHCYQVGAGPMWRFVREFVSGNTHDPIGVFRSTLTEWSRGNHPVICIAQNYDFSGFPHCVLPVSWDDTAKLWKITVCDPNFPLITKEITVDPDNNTFEYVSSSSRVYRGGQWSGGRFHYMPFCELNSRPRTPIWEAVLLLLTGVILIVGDDAETTSITDINGNDLDGLGQRATDQLRTVHHLNNYFVPMKGWGGRSQRTVSRDERRRTKGTVPGEIYLRKKATFNFTITPPALDPYSATHLGLSAIMATAAGRTLTAELRNQPMVLRSIQDRSAHFVASDAATMARLTPVAQGIIRRFAAATSASDFKHTIRGVHPGSFTYAAKHTLSEFRLQSDIRLDEDHILEVRDLGTSKSTVNLSSTRSKLINVQVIGNLGVRRDEVKITFEGVPIEARSGIVMNIKPGLGGLELLTSRQGAQARVTFETTLGGNKIVRQFGMPVGGGMRLKTSQLLSDTTINVSHIDHLFGPVTGTSRINTAP